MRIAFAIEFARSKQSQVEILTDIFENRRDDVLESGLTDAKGGEVFDTMLVSLDEKWSALHTNGRVFFDWFVSRKRGEFINSVVSTVRQRSGLGCPPDRFTTNQSEQTNRAIHKFVKSEWKRAKKIDEFTFSVCFPKLVNQQKQEVELAVLCRGEYKLREKFKLLEVSSQEWESMREKQKKKALQQLQKVSLEEATSTTAVIAKIVRSCDNAFLKTVRRQWNIWIIFHGKSFHTLCRKLLL